MKLKTLAIAALLAGACAPEPDNIPAWAREMGVGVEFTEYTPFALTGSSGCPGPVDDFDGQNNTIALNQHNLVRTSLGWSCATSQTYGANAYAAVAYDHALYLESSHLSQNAGCWPSDPHDEKATHGSIPCENFKGVSPYDRAVAHSRTNWMGEVIIVNGGHVGGIPSDVDIWMRTPYHRMPFLDKRQNISGYGYRENVPFQQSEAVMDFFGDASISRTTYMGIWPPPGTSGWRRSFDGSENPQPPAPPTGWPSGYPISIDYGAMHITDGWLIDATTGAWVPTTRVYESADPNGMLLKGQGFMYANTPLAANHTFQVHFVGTLNGGGSTDVWWSFNTGADL